MPVQRSDFDDRASSCRKTIVQEAWEYFFDSLAVGFSLDFDLKAV